MTKYYNELCQPWCLLSDEVKESIRKAEVVVRMLDDGGWARVHLCLSFSFCPNDIVRAVEPEKKPLGREDIKPLGREDIKPLDVPRRVGSENCDFCYFEAFVDGVVLVLSDTLLKYADLMETYGLNFVGENWRGCSK